MEDENGQMELRRGRACRGLNTYQPLEDETLSESSTTVAPESTVSLFHNFITALTKEREAEKARRLSEEQSRKDELAMWKAEEQARRKEEEEKRKAEEARREAETTRLLYLLLDKEEKARKHQLELADKNRMRTPLPKWSDNDVPYNFFMSLEQALTFNEEPKENWHRILPLQLTGRAKAALDVDIFPEDRQNYEVMKSKILTALGDIPERAAESWWTIKGSPGESPDALVSRIAAMNNRRLSKCKTIADVISFTNLSLFFTLLSPEAATYVRSQRPETAREAARISTQFNELVKFGTGFIYRQDDRFGRQYGRQPGVNGGESGQRWQKHQGQRLAQPAVSRQLCDKTEPWVNDSGANGASINNQHSGSHNIVQPNVTCYGCGKPGHKKPQCPDIIRRVK